MAIIKCKMCGGDIEISADKTFGTCEYCGSTMTLPKVDDEQRAAAFNRGNHFRRSGEFDKALAVYERIVAEDDNDAEAHWCCALCRFGIEYVEDPATYEWLPTCHRASFDSFLEDVDYLAAVEHSDGITRRQYQKDAAKIAEVQRGILATSSLCQRMVMLFFCMACGFCAAKGGAMDVQSNKKLSSLIVTVANPMQILASALTGERLLSIGQTLRLMGLIALLYAALIGLSFPIARLLRVKEREAGLYRFMFIFGNIGFLGYPVVESLLGYQATFYVTLAVLAFQLLCWSYGVSLIEGQARFHFQWKILRQPCVAASLAAFVIYLSGWQPPVLLHQTVKYVGDITSPIAMLIVGCSLAQMRFGQIFGNWRVYVLVLFKMIAVPLLAHFALRQVLDNERILCVLTVLLCMPIATNTTILSYQYGADETTASSGVFVSTLLCMLTIPLMMKLLFGT